MQILRFFRWIKFSSPKNSETIQNQIKIDPKLVPGAVPRRQNPAKIKKNEKFSTKNIRSIRPGYGMAPSYYNQIIGKKASVDLDPGTPMHPDFILN